MDKIMIFGVFEFVGFHLCKGFLEQGYNVKGIHIDTRQDCFLEEKRLEVGRNANFEEQTLKQWQVQNNRGEESAMMIFPLYDWYMTYTEAVVEQEKLVNLIFHHLHSRREQKDKAVFLLPIQLLVDFEGREELITLEKFVEQIEKMITNCQFIYLPTIYGPWQPPTFLFQKAILKSLNANDEQTDPVSREWAVDAMFIDDALDSLVKIIDGEKIGKCILESGVKNSWETCGDLLEMDHTFRWKADHRTLSVTGQLERIIADKSTPAADALLIQLKHLSRLLGK